MESCGSTVLVQVYTLFNLLLVVTGTRILGGEEKNDLGNWKTLMLLSLCKQYVSSSHGTQALAERYQDNHLQHSFAILRDSLKKAFVTRNPVYTYSLFQLLT